MKIKRERKTNEIIDAAEKMFFSRGFNETTMENIATELELTKPALYRYFQSKEDLYYAVVLRGEIILSEMIDIELASKKTGKDKILAIGLAYCRFYQEYSNYSRLMLDTKSNLLGGKDCKNFQKLSEYNRNHLKIMCDAIETGKHDGSIRTDIDTFMTALYLVESTIAIMQLSENMDTIINSTEKDKEDFIRHSFMLMGNSLKNEKIKYMGD